MPVDWITEVLTMNLAVPIFPVMKRGIVVVAILEWNASCARRDCDIWRLVTAVLFQVGSESDEFAVAESREASARE